MGRWTQYEEDSYIMPEGIKRIAYDADTRVYTFRDENGKLYQGAPGAEGGLLTPVSNTETSRPSAFESEMPRSPNAQSKLTSFHDILPANSITSVTSSEGKPPNTPRIAVDKAPRAQFVGAVRKVALPSMQGVVHSLRRISSKRQQDQPPEEGKSPLLKTGFLDVRRSPSPTPSR
ncbi:hypothetical protein H0H81_001240 [Sphagnurus paluster]|uniref:Uncharacterized protein n=1 Tax=Sphagnurus paluster TaxID=117069 RepID=A0A9P7FMQ3_9AGAR|nr:hypothetical protein H0H81_001240 [Sphagnurus paluster]